MKFPQISDRQHLSEVRGFTLTELLIVIGIVAVLAAMLMGGVQALSGSGSAAKCTANLRSIGVAFAGYLSEHKGVLPPMSALSNPADPKSEVLLGQAALMPYLGMPDDFNWKQNSPAASAFGVWICPADREERPSKLMPELPRWKALNSYLINYYIGKGAVTESGGNMNSRTVLRMTEVSNPSEVWYYADGIRTDGGQGRLTEGVVSAADNSAIAGGVRLSFRHGHRLQALTLAGNVLSFSAAEVRGQGLRLTVPMKSGSL